VIGDVGFRELVVPKQQHPRDIELDISGSDDDRPPCWRTTLSSLPGRALGTKRTARAASASRRCDEVRLVVEGIGALTNSVAECSAQPIALPAARARRSLPGEPFR
jgi:hypothetical protein